MNLRVAAPLWCGLRVCSPCDRCAAMLHTGDAGDAVAPMRCGARNLDLCGAGSRCGEGAQGIPACWARGCGKLHGSVQGAGLVKECVQAEVNPSGKQ